MRIALPIWEQKVSPVLDTASRLLVVNAAAGAETARFEAVFTEPDISHRCSFIVKLEVDTLICGALSRQFSRMLTASGVTVVAGISGPIDAVLAAHLAGRLSTSTFFLPGCGGKTGTRPAAEQPEPVENISGNDH